MEKFFELVVYSEGNRLFFGSVYSVTFVSGKMEELTILANHIPIVSDLVSESPEKKSIFRFRTRDSQKKELNFSSGLFRFQHGNATAHLAGLN